MPAASRRRELVLLQRAAVFRVDAQTIGLQADRGLLQIDDFDARHRP